MPIFNTDVNISAPAHTEIRLVREDQLEVSNLFRTGFEIGLALTAALLGIVYCSEKLSGLEWGFLGVTSSATILCLCLTHSFKKKARDSHQIQDPVTRGHTTRRGPKKGKTIVRRARPATTPPKQE